MNPTETPHTTPPPPPLQHPPAAARRHSTLRVVAAALAGIALGVAGVMLLSPSPITGPSAAPAALVDDTPAAGGGTTTDPGATTPQGGVVDQAVAEQAALAHLGEGQVTWVSPEDDRGAAWEIEVTLPDGREVDVLVDAAGAVIEARQGLERWLP